jgi:transcriptional regulator with XRE-family HTH domain
MTPLGKFIRDERDRRGWSQEELAARADMAASELSNVERGARGLPKPPRMIAIARALNMHVSELYVVAGFPEFGGRYTRTVEPNVRADEETPTA